MQILQRPLKFIGNQQCKFFDMLLAESNNFLCPAPINLHKLINPHRMDNIINSPAIPKAQNTNPAPQTDNANLITELKSQKYQQQIINYVKARCHQITTSMPSLPLIASMLLYDCQVSRFETPNCCVSVREIPASCQSIKNFYVKPENRRKILPNNFIIELQYISQEAAQPQPMNKIQKQKQSIPGQVKREMIDQGQIQQSKHLPTPIDNIENKIPVNMAQWLLPSPDIPKLQIQKWIVQLGWPLMNRQFVVALFFYVPKQQPMPQSINSQSQHKTDSNIENNQHKTCYIAWKSCSYACELEQPQNMREQITGGVILESITTNRTKVTMMVQSKNTMVHLRHFLHQFAKSIFKIQSYLKHKTT